MNDKYYDKIDDFLMDRLTSESLADFVKQMTIDAELKQEVEIRKVMMEQVIDLGDIRMHEKLKKIKEKVIVSPAKTVQSPNRSRRKVIQLILSAAAVFLCLFLVRQLLLSPPSPAALYAQHNHAYPIPFGDRAEGGDRDLLAAGNLYREGNYVQALPALQTVLENTNNKDDRIFFAIGICQLEIQEYSAAIGTFKQMKQNANNLYLEQADWYSILAYLSLNDLASAKSLLESIVKNEKHYFHKSANQLLEKIK